MSQFARPGRAESDLLSVGAEGREGVIGLVVGQLNDRHAVDVLEIDIGMFAVAGAGEDHPFAGGIDGDITVEAFIEKRVLLEPAIAMGLGLGTLDAVEFTVDVDRRSHGDVG